MASWVVSLSLAGPVNPGFRAESRYPTTRGPCDASSDSAMPRAGMVAGAQARLDGLGTDARIGLEAGHHFPLDVSQRGFESICGR